MAAGQHYHQAQQEATRHRDLNPAGIEAALAFGGMLGTVDRRTAIFATQGQALQQPQQQQQHRGQQADLGKGRQEADGGGCPAHKRNGD